MESFQKLGQKRVPAIIREVSEEDMLLMGLVENIARHNPSPMETVRHLVALRDRGYSHREIGEKVGLGPSYVSENLYLYDHGEEHLLAALETGRVPLPAAIIIARSDDHEVQTALLEAVEQKQLTTAELHRARKLALMRKTFGKALHASARRKPLQPVSGQSIVKAFRKEQAKQRQALKKAELCERQLAFAVNAVRMLVHNEDFTNLLRAEGLATLPEHLAELVKEGDRNG